MSMKPDLHPHDGQGPEVDRRTLLGSALVLGGAMAVGSALPAAAAPQIHTASALRGTSRGRHKFRNSMSVTPFTEVVLGQTSLMDGKHRARTVRGVQELFNHHGASEMYVRVATLKQARDGDAEHGLTRALERARLARKLGMPLNPELGLWAIYGDIALQPSPDFSDYPQITLPGPWITLTIDQMCTAMRSYGRLVARQILSTGVDVNVWDLGNEVEFGVAGVAVRSYTTSAHDWTYQPPDAVNPEIGKVGAFDLFAMSSEDRVDWLKTNLWPYVGRIFAAVADGIRSVDRHAKFSTHTSSTVPLLPGVAVAFWQSMADAGFEAAHLGSSYYPTSVAFGDQLAGFKDMATTLHDTFGKPVFLAETGYPSGTMGSPYAWNAAVDGYPLDADGQYRFFRDLTQWGATEGTVSGIRLWAPDYCTTHWQPMSGFASQVDNRASAKPVLDAVRDGLKLAR